MWVSSFAESTFAKNIGHHTPDHSTRFITTLSAETIRRATKCNEQEGTERERERELDGNFNVRKKRRNQRTNIGTKRIETMEDRQRINKKISCSTYAFQHFLRNAS